jgi:hypothetical protein
LSPLPVFLSIIDNKWRKVYGKIYGLAFSLIFLTGSFLNKALRGMKRSETEYGPESACSGKS